jgi:hypothetical protein
VHEDLMQAIPIDAVSKDTVQGSCQLNCIEQAQVGQWATMTIAQSIVAIMLALLFAVFLVIRLLAGHGVIGVMTEWKLYALLVVVTSLVGLFSIIAGNRRA